MHVLQDLSQRAANGRSERLQRVRINLPKSATLQGVVHEEHEVVAGPMAPRPSSSFIPISAPVHSDHPTEVGGAPGFWFRVVGGGGGRRGYAYLAGF